MKVFLNDNGTNSKNRSEYEELGFAIAEQAAIDFITLHRVKKSDLKGKYESELKRFFASDWCFMLCGIEESDWERFIEKYDIK
jgi:hypothetical protein